MELFFRPVWFHSIITVTVQLLHNVRAVDGHGDEPVFPPAFAILVGACRVIGVVEAQGHAAALPVCQLNAWPVHQVEIADEILLYRTAACHHQVQRPQTGRRDNQDKGDIKQDMPDAEPLQLIDPVNARLQEGVPVKAKGAPQHGCDIQTPEQAVADAGLGGGPQRKYAEERPTQPGEDRAPGGHRIGEVIAEPICKGGPETQLIRVPKRCDAQGPDAEKSPQHSSSRYRRSGQCDRYDLTFNVVILNRDIVPVADGCQQHKTEEGSEYMAFLPFCFVF